MSFSSAYFRAERRASQILHLLSEQEREDIYEELWDDLAFHARALPHEDHAILQELYLAEQNERASLLAMYGGQDRILLWLRLRCLALQAASKLYIAMTLAGKEGASDAQLLDELLTPTLPPPLWPTGKDILFHDPGDKWLSAV